MSEPKKQRRCMPLLALAYSRALPQLVALAREHGYALALHGSMETDLDLLACPWHEDAVAPEVLAEALREAVNGTFERPEWLTESNPVTKPHGRLAWSIYLNEPGKLPYIDLSVMPRYPMQPCFFCNGKGSGIEGVSCTWCEFIRQPEETVSAAEGG